MAAFFGKAFPAVPWVFCSATVEKFCVKLPEIFGGNTLRKGVHLNPIRPFLEPPWPRLALAIPASELGMLSGQGRVWGCNREACCSAARALPSPHLYEAGPEERVLSIPPTDAWTWSSLQVSSLTVRQGSGGRARLQSARVGVWGGGGGAGARLWALSACPRGPTASQTRL